MAQQSAPGQAPIPAARKDDTEDVAWALSTAEAMYARGDRSDALKWLRRAAESANEAQDDDRALELAKAAAELAALVGPSTSAPPPARPSQAPPAARAVPPPAGPIPPAAPVPAAAPYGSPIAPPPAPAPAVAPAPGRVAAQRPTTTPVPVTPPVAAQAPRALARPLPPAAAAAPAPAAPPSAPRVAESRRAARRSRPDIDIARRPDEPTQTLQDMALPLQPKRRPRSRPAAEELTPHVPPVTPPAAPNPAPAPAALVAASPDATPSLGIRTDDIDAWPTQSRGGLDDLDYEPPDEKTRIGVPAYEASARMATEARSNPSLEEAPVRVSQAIRVVVWRTPEGVQVAPHGTHVAAITVDAMLVGLDPDAELASWLTRK